MRTLWVGGNWGREGEGGGVLILRVAFKFPQVIHTLQLNVVFNRFHYWRASVTSETLTGVTQLKIGDVCLSVYGRT